MLKAIYGFYSCNNQEGQETTRSPRLNFEIKCLHDSLLNLLTELHNRIQAKVKRKDLFIFNHY
jgi:hypothetical protein